MKIEKVNMRVDDIVDLDRPHIDRPVAMLLLCPRRAVWESRMTLREFVMDVERAKAMIVGGIAHSALTFRHECEKEVPIEVECCSHVFRFRADAVCNVGSERVVVEVKLTLRNAYYWALWQLTVYMSFLGIKKGMLVGLRDNLVYRVELSDEDVERTQKWFMENLEMWYLGKDVKRPGRHCESCPFRMKCLNSTLV